MTEIEALHNDIVNHALKKMLAELDALRAEVAALRQQLASKDQTIAELRSVMFERAMAIK